MPTSDYDQRSWARQTTLGRRLFNHNFRMAGKGPPGWNLIKAVPMARDAKRTETTWLWQAAGEPDELVQVNVTELADWRAAQKNLLAILGQSMRPAVPRGAGNLAEFGDVIFAARDPIHDRQASAQFVRGNVTAAIRSVGAVAVDVTAFVKFVDGMLSGGSDEGRARSSSRNLLSTEVGGNGVTVLPLDLAESDAWLRLVASDGEFRRKGRTIEHVASDGGESIVELFATNP